LPARPGPTQATSPGLLGREAAQPSKSGPPARAAPPALTRSGQERLGARGRRSTRGAIRQQRTHPSRALPRQAGTSRGAESTVQPEWRGRPRAWVLSRRRRTKHMRQARGIALRRTRRRRAAPPVHRITWRAQVNSEGRAGRAKPFAVAALAGCRSLHLHAVTHRPRWACSMIGHRQSSSLRSRSLGPSLSDHA